MLSVPRIQCDSTIPNWPIYIERVTSLSQHIPGSETDFVHPAHISVYSNFHKQLIRPSPEFSRCELTAAVVVGSDLNKIVQHSTGPHNTHTIITIQC